MWPSRGFFLCPRFCTTATRYRTNRRKASACVISDTTGHEIPTKRAAHFPHGRPFHIGSDRRSRATEGEGGVVDRRTEARNEDAELGLTRAYVALSHALADCGGTRTV